MMSFTWLKRYFPSGLYGRAAMILILPIVFLQLVVSIAFIQRHYEDVAGQMTKTMVQELQLVLRVINGAANADLARSNLNSELMELDFSVEFNNGLILANKIRWFDFSGRVIIQTLQDALPELKAIQLPDNRIVVLQANTVHGLVNLSFARWRVSASNPHQLLVTMIFFGILMTVIAYLFLRNQLRSITKLADAAQAFGHGHNITYTPTGATEVRAAGQAFLEMRDQIERDTEQKNLMLSGVSHDLRTPLTRMKLGLSFFENEQVELLLRDVEAMERLINEFLNYVNGVSEEKEQLINPKSVLISVVEDAQRLGFSVTTMHNDDIAEIMLKPNSLRRALENLISNGVRYGDHVVTSIEFAEKFICFVVEDDGPGIPEDKVAESVKPFVRLDLSRNQDKGAGVGLGLAIVTEICRSLGGKLYLSKSNHLGGLKAEIVIKR